VSAWIATEKIREEGYYLAGLPSWPITAVELARVVVDDMESMSAFVKGRRIDLAECDGWLWYGPIPDPVPPMPEEPVA
jgi:hypothetical protein